MVLDSVSKLGVRTVADYNDLDREMDVASKVAEHLLEGVSGE